MSQETEEESKSSITFGEKTLLPIWETKDKEQEFFLPEQTPIQQTRLLRLLQLLQ